MAADRGEAGAVELSGLQAGRDALAAGRDLTVYHYGPPPMPQAVTRSAYLEQVRRIAPPDPPGLRDREDELAELARFCLDPDGPDGSGGPAYAWWRAGPWAGKSALLSTFVLRPPAEVRERARVVSFFITSRLAAQDTREAFTQVLAEQLAELTGQVLPGVLPEPTRDGYLLDLLARAASQCQSAGGRLILVVDGLDEDRGVTTGPHAHSIAGLLPADPPAGMRVIVAGRPDPPVPDDVPDWHPLRDPSIVRPLAASPHASDIRRLGRQELTGLLNGPAAGRDLTGLLTAARGGLTAPDLADLADIPLWETEKILHTAAGRAFTRRASRWTPGDGTSADGTSVDGAPADGTETYLLGHEELQAAAERYLAADLPGYRDRLHAWAGRYRDRGWPDGTPEYLLSGYYRLLTGLGDQERMVACATDPARHDRLLDLTGGDAEALAETGAALDLIAAQQAPDLSSALAVVGHRDRIITRNSHVPGTVPVVWAMLGQVTRAEALADSITFPSRRSHALARVALALARTGQDQEAIRIAGKAEQAAFYSRSPGQEGDIPIPALIAVALAWAGQDQEAARITRNAESAVRACTSPDLMVEALSELAETLAGETLDEAAVAAARHAADIAITITDPADRPDALARAARALSITGQEDAAEFARRAETAARDVAEPDDGSLIAVADSLARTGQFERAEAVARSAASREAQAISLGRVAVALTDAGHEQRAVTITAEAEATVRAIADPERRIGALVAVVQALASVGQDERAEAVACSADGEYHQSYVLMWVAMTLARKERFQHAEAVAHSISELDRQAAALAGVAESLAVSGQHQQAKALVREAEESARRSGAGPREQVERELLPAARALFRAGYQQQAADVAGKAETVARSEHRRRSATLAQIADTVADMGQQQKAAALAEEALAEEMSGPRPGGWVLAEVAGTLVAAGALQKAEEVRGAIADPGSLAQVAITLARTGQRQAAETAARAKAAACSVTNPQLQVSPLVQAAEALAKTGQAGQAVELFEQAETIAYSRFGSFGNHRASALKDIACGLAKIGRYQRAEEIALSIAGYGGFEVPVLQCIAQELAEAGQHARAEEIARTITDPEQRGESLAVIAEALIETGSLQEAARLTAEACTTAPWKAVVGPVLRLDPSASPLVIRMIGDADTPLPALPPHSASDLPGARQRRAAKSRVLNGR